MLVRLVSFCLLSAFPLLAQSTLADLQSRLLHQPLYLSGQWSEEKLNFDGKGTLIGTSKTVSFTLSGIEVGSLKLDSKGLRIDGKRVGLEFVENKAVRTPLPNSIRITVAAPPDGNYTLALNNIFFSDVSSFIPQLPPIWQDNKLRALLDPSLPSPDSPKPPSDESKRNRDRATPPAALVTPAPQYNPYARDAHLAGDVLIYLEVDQQGLPQKIRILHPLGLGLDEAAAYAVSQYRFKPAEMDGKPVRVVMNVEVKFQSY